MSIYDEGAERLWGRPAQPLLGASSYEAATMATQLSVEAAALKKVVEDNYARFPKSFVDMFNAWLVAWDSFISHVSGKKLKWYDIKGKMGASFAVLFYGPEIYNHVIDFRRKFNVLWAAASKVMQQDATAFKPEDPPAKVSTTPVTDTINKVVTGVIVVAAIGGGIYLWSHRDKSPAK